MSLQRDSETSEWKDWNNSYRKFSNGRLFSNNNNHVVCSYTIVSFSYGHEIPIKDPNQHWMYLLTSIICVSKPVYPLQSSTVKNY